MTGCDACYYRGFVMVERGDGYWHAVSQGNANVSYALDSVRHVHAPNEALKLFKRKVDEVLGAA